jgi:hypothetical protein
MGSVAGLVADSVIIVLLLDRLASVLAQLLSCRRGAIGVMAVGVGSVAMGGNECQTTQQ